ncbi:RICIN domain-containing protein [Streptomyces sp. NPDC001546]|uniref:RICIN domain-containing protein n=1 Tax=Streptomyces sp. NPDC001546 TaxID=3364585 RepID=UPI0036A7FDD4
MSRQTWSVVAVLFPLLALGLTPGGATAGDCDNFPGGICPGFGDPWRPPNFGDDWWKIRSAFTKDLVLTAPYDLGLRPHRARVILQSDRNDENQQFRFRIINGKYQIEVRGTGLCLQGNEHTNGRIIVSQNDCNEPSDAQTWVIKRHPKGRFWIRSGYSNDRCLEAASTSQTGLMQVRVTG